MYAGVDDGLRTVGPGPITLKKTLTAAPHELGSYACFLLQYGVIGLLSPTLNARLNRTSRQAESS